MKSWIFVYLVLIVVGAVSGVCPKPMPEGMILCDDFEEGNLWDYNDNWIYPDQADEWDAVMANSHSGSYCVQSKLPGGGPFDDSRFDVGISIEENEIFVRFWFRTSPNLTCDWAQFLRFKGGLSQDLEIGPTGYQTDPRIGDSCGSIRVSESGVDLFDGIYQDSGLGNPFVDTEWTEYAFYLNYEENLLYFWRNADAYTISDSGFTAMTGVNYNGWRINLLSLPMYYKSFWSETAGQDELFWMDDIEIWYGLPGLVPECSGVENRSCATGFYGICSLGSQSCVDGSWGSCVQNFNSSVEVCGNGEDEDCDGSDLVCGLDFDGDGVNSSLDCDDNDSLVWVEVNCSFNGSVCGDFSVCGLSCPVVPEEICGNGVDEDCDGEDLVCVCVHDADLVPCDGVVSVGELGGYIDLWLGGGVSMGEVMGAISAWAG